MSYVIGIAWFKDEPAYRRALAVFTDPENMPARFEDWKGIVERQCELVRAGGNVPIRADIDPDTFVRWCAVHGVEPNSSGRTAFVKQVEIEYQKSGKGTVIE